MIVKSPVWDDLRTIGFRIAKDNPDAAERFVTAAEAAFELLRQHPPGLDACAASLCRACGPG